MTWKTETYSGWGRALKATGQIARPERVAALTRLSAEIPAPAIGARRSYGDAALNDGGRAIDMTRLDRMLGFDEAEGIVEVEAGMRIGELGTRFAPRGWIPAVMPGTGFATVGGCIANDVHGKNHHEVGSFGQHVTEITLLQKGKARRITPERDAELFRATVAGLGQTGIILAAKLKLMPCKGDMMVLTERRIGGWDEFLEALDNSRYDFTVGWIDATATGDALGRGILEEGEITSGIPPTPGRNLKVPLDAPPGALSAPVVKAFNALYYRRVPPSGRTTVKPIAAPYFPLDAIHDWNRLYGKRGFHQFQCVVPVAEADALRRMLERIAHSGLASPLSVLKRMGPGSAGYLSFPMEGYTLAVDFPARPEAPPLIAELNAMTGDAGGRVYLAKDALLAPDLAAAMYPDLPQWRKVVAKADPDRAYVTDLVRRLQLREEA